jgi:glutaredoxin
MFAFGNNEESTSEEFVFDNLPHESEIILYYTNDNCPDCEEIKDWIVQNQADEKIEIIQKEVEQNQENIEQLVAVAQSCGIKEGLSVPFVYGDGNCLMENSEIINYFENKIGEK